MEEQEIVINLEDDNQEIDINLEDRNEEININQDDVVFVGTSNYEELRNKPKINNVELNGNKSLQDLGIEADKTYLHIQSVASNEWLINHGLNKYPAVSIIDSAENEVIGEVEYIDANNVKLKFAGSFSGKATLN